MLKVNNKDTRTTPMAHLTNEHIDEHINEHISYLDIVFLLLTLNM